MGRQVGIVKGQQIAVWQDSDIALRLIDVQLLGGDTETVEWYDIVGEDTAPVEGDRVVVFEIAENYKIAIATKDLIVAAVSAGERKFYSRDSSGSVQAEFYLKADGSVDLDAPGDMNITGNVNIIGNLDVDGDITATGDISAEGDVVADSARTAISLLNHLHLGNLGYNTDEPLPDGGGVPKPATPASFDSGTGDIIDGNGTKSTNHVHGGVTSGGSNTGIAT